MIPGSFTLVAWAVTASLIVPAAIDRSVSWPEPGTAMSLNQKDSGVEALVSSATECIARTVAANPRLAGAKGAVEFNELIVQSVPFCTDDLRAMIDAYDRIYGDGAGETFFSGDYLDNLPAAVTVRVQLRPQTGDAGPK